MPHVGQWWKQIVRWHPDRQPIFLFYPISLGCKPTAGSFSQRVERPLQSKILSYVFGIVNLTILPSHYFFPLLTQLYRFSHPLFLHLHIIGILSVHLFFCSLLTSHFPPTFTTIIFSYYLLSYSDRTTSTQSLLFSLQYIAQHNTTLLLINKFPNISSFVPYYTPNLTFSYLLHTLR